MDNENNINNNSIEEENGNNGKNNAVIEGKTFSQEEVNHIVGERLAKEKNKNETEILKKEEELQQREIRLNAREILTEKGLSMRLLEAVNCTSTEAMNKSISIIEEVFNDYKNEVPKFKFKGVHIAEGSSPDPIKDDPIREAMGLEG